VLAKVVTTCLIGEEVKKPHSGIISGTSGNDCLEVRGASKQLCLPSLSWLNFLIPHLLTYYIGVWSVYVKVVYNFFGE